MTVFSRTFIAVAGCISLVGLAACQGIQQPAPGEKQTPAISHTEDSARHHYLLSQLSDKRGETEQAMADLTRAIELDPESSLLKRELVRLHLKMNHMASAMTLAQELVQKDPDNAENLILLVRLKKEDASEKELEFLLNRILELAPGHKESYLRLGKILMNAQRHGEALDLFSRMTREFPTYYVAHFYQGEAKMLTKDMEGALAAFRKTLELEPDLVEPRFRLFDIYRSQDSDPDFKTQYALLEEILELAPEDERAQLETALILEKTQQSEKADQAFAYLGERLAKDSRLAAAVAEIFLSADRNMDALKIFNRLLKDAPDNDQLNFFTAMAHESMGDKEKAIEYYLKVSPAHPHYKKMMFSIAFLYRDMERTEEARLLLEDLHEQRPRDIDVIIYLSSFYEEDQDYPEAVALLEKGLALSPDNTTLLFRLGVIQDKKGDKEACIATMEKVIAIDPKDASALNYLGYTYADLGIHLDMAKGLITRALEVKPEDGFITDSLGWIYYKMEDYEKAVTILERAARLSKDETIISEHLGDAYAKTGQIQKAKAAYLKAIKNAKEGDADRIKELRKKILDLPSDQP